jgi:polysaccharide biosynthesis protein PslH
MNIISLVSYPFLPARSGGQKGIALFYKYFSRHHSVTIVTTKKNQPALAAGYELLNILPDAAYRYINPFIFFTIRKLIREKKATHLILEHPYYGWLGMLLKRFCGIKLIVHSHNLEGNRWKTLGKWWWRILWNYERTTHRHADYNFFIQDADRDYAIRAFGLKEEKCLTVSFGTEIAFPPSPKEKSDARQILLQQLQIPEMHSLILFNGVFNYSPNRDALDNLLSKVNPILQHRTKLYSLLILGLNIPESIFKTPIPGVYVLGFVENLELYLTGCDVFLNPVLSGGGIKTKLVEALAYNLSTVSTENGAIGVDPGLCNGKLFICADHDWNSFADAAFRATEMKSIMPASFYQHFYWGNITRRAAEFIAKKNLLPEV